MDNFIKDPALNHNNVTSNAEDMPSSLIEFDRTNNSDIGKMAFCFLISIILVIAAFLRLHYLDVPPIWMDEAFTYHVAKQPIQLILFGHLDNHPPLFYAVQHLWWSFVPASRFLRVPAAVFGVGMVLVVGLAAADLASRRAGIMAAALVALSTGNIYMSQDARMYTLVSLGVALAGWGLAGLNDKTSYRWSYSLLYLFGGVIAIYSQVIGLICLFAINVTVLISAVQQRSHSFYRPWILSNLALLILSAPWFFALTEAVGTFPGEKRYALSLLPWFFLNMVGFPGLPGGIKQSANILLVVGAVLGAYILWSRRRRGLAMIGLGLLLAYPVLIALINSKVPVLVNRVFLPCEIGIALLAASGIAALERPWVRIFGAVVLLTRPIHDGGGFALSSRAAELSA